MLVSEFNYALPGELIAQHPAPRRTASRLLHLDSKGRLQDLAFTDLPSLVGSGDALVLNDTRVIKARLAGKKRSGGRVEVFVERILGERDALALIRASHAPAAGAEIVFATNAFLQVGERVDDLYRVRFSGNVAAILERFGAVPLPPYIRHAPARSDAERYQTVYATQPGAVAAPTAGLHFDRKTLEAIRRRGATIAKLTLHVGAGTFQPVRGEVVEAHRMHKERFSIPESTRKALAGKRVLAVGTTSLRALESTTQGETDLFIYPGFQFRVVDRLLTNFHLPKSTLLMLVCAFAGTDNIMKAYRHAIAKRYRFFSYGDAMLIER